MEDLMAPIIFTLVIGGVAGYFSGKLFRKISSVAMAIVVVAFIIIAMAYAGNLNVNFDSITANISNVLGIITPLGIVALVSSVPFVASFVAGLFIGYRRY